jgi:hypothetical protein
MKKDFEEAGFKIQVKQLTDFQDGYGLEVGEDEADEDEDEEMGSGSESGSESEED